MVGETRIVNIRRTSDYNVYVGRAGHGHDGYFGNPIRVGKQCPVCGGVHRKGGGTLYCFEQYARQRMQEDPEYRRRVKGLKGKVLGCFCAGEAPLTSAEPLRCHGQVLAALAEEE